MPAPRSVSSPARPARLRVASTPLAFALAATGVLGCGPDAAPAPPPEAPASVAGPAVDPAAAVRTLATDLPRALRRLAAAAEPPVAYVRRAWDARKLDLYEAPVVERLYAAEDAVYRYVGEDALTPLGARLVESLSEENLKAEGLNPTHFHMDGMAKLRKRLENALAEAAAVPVPPPPTEAEVTALVTLARTLPPGPPEDPLRPLVARIAAPDGPLPAWAAAVPALTAAQKTVDEARARIELRLADALAHYVDVMAPGNLASEERAARRALRAAAPAPASEAPEGSDPSQATAERGGADTPAPAVVSAPAGAPAPPILADRAGFLIGHVTGLVSAVKTPADLDALIARAAPRHPQYAPLRAALNRYRAVADVGFVKVTRGALGPGSAGPNVTALQARLAQEGLFTPPTTGRFDAATEAAVRRFQTSRRLEETGSMNKRTWDELEVPVGRRLRAIDRAMDSVRQSRIDDETYFILVNIPDFHLELWRDGKRVVRKKVAVGKAGGTVCDERTRRLAPAYATPRLSAEMSKIVLAPYWLVTKDIKEKEYDPQRARDPLFYEKNGYEVINRGRGDEWVRQLPSPANSLGLVKMLFPNEHAVYIHDTPQKFYFEQRFRAVSHGCVRLEKPEELAQLVLEYDGQWDPPAFERLRSEWAGMERLLKPYDEDNYRRALRKGMELQTEIRLKDPVPVSLEYYTAQVADDGVVEFMHDLYGHDVGKWSARNAPTCVPESVQARQNTEDLHDEIDRLEREAVGLGSRIEGLSKYMGRLRAGDKDEKFLAARAKGLTDFVAAQKTYASTLRAAHDKVQKALDKRKGEWSKELQSDAVKVKRLVDGFKKANDRARKLCEEVEKRGS